MFAIIIAFLIPVFCIGLIIYIVSKRRKNTKGHNPLMPDTHEQIPLLKGLIFQLAPVIGFFMILFYFVFKSEGVIYLSGVYAWVFWLIALIGLSLYRKVQFKFVKSESGSGYKLVALKQRKVTKDL